MEQSLLSRETLPSVLSPARSSLTTANSQSRWIIEAAGLALLIKLVIAWNTFGTNDVITFYIFGEWLAHHGLEWTYQHTILFNHPPLTAVFLRSIYWLCNLPLLQTLGVSYPFLLRLPGILADFVVVLLLVSLNRRSSVCKIPCWALLLFAFSPLSIMVSGYHGNTDPVMVMFLVLAYYFCALDRPFLCGMALALSVQVKIIPLLLVPLFFGFWFERRRAIGFSVFFAGTSFVLWSQPLLQYPRIFFHNVLSYSSYWGIWGISYLLRLTGGSEFQHVSFFGLTAKQNLVILICKVAIFAAILLMTYLRRSARIDELGKSIAVAWLVFFVFAPGVCVQYLVWLAPFVLLASPKVYGWLTVASSIFAFIFYDTISHHLPWFRGVSTNTLNKIWAPWSLLPWAVLMVAAILIWRGWRKPVIDQV